jgi:hypothetical protein
MAEIEVLAGNLSEIQSAEAKHRLLIPQHAQRFDDFGQLEEEGKVEGSIDSETIGDSEERTARMGIRPRSRT